MSTSSFGIFLMKDLHPTLKPLYTIEITGSRSYWFNQINNYVKAPEFFIEPQHLKTYIFDLERQGSVLHFQVVTVDRKEIDIGINVDAIIHIIHESLIPKFKIDVESCPIQMLCIPYEPENLKNKEIPIAMFYDGKDEIYELLDTIADWIIQKEYIHQKYSRSADILNFFREEIDFLYPHLLVGYQATTILMPRSAKKILPRTFIGMVNPFNLILADTEIETICENVFDSIPIQSLDFPETLKVIKEENFINCDHLKRIDLSKTKVEVISGNFNNLSVNSIVFPDTLKKVGIYCSQNQIINELSFVNTRLEVIEPHSFKEFKGKLKIDLNRPKIIPVSFLSMFFDNGVIDMSQSSIEEITEDFVSIKDPVENILFPETLKKCASQIFSIVSKKTEFDFSQTTLESLGSRFTPNESTDLIEDKIQRLILPSTCKSIHSSFLHLFIHSNNVIDIRSLPIETLYVDFFLNYKVLDIKFPDSLREIKKVNLSCGTKLYESVKQHMLFDLVETKIHSLDLSNTKIELLEQFISSKSLQSILLPSNLKKIGDSSFSTLTLNQIDLSTTSVEEIGSCCFHYSEINSIILPPSLRSIGNLCFSYLKIKLIDLSNSCIRDLPERTFYYSTLIQTVLLPKHLETIGEECFRGCVDLKSVEIPKSTYNISGNAFANTFMKILLFPEKVHNYRQCISNYSRHLYIITLAKDYFNLTIDGNSMNVDVIHLDQTKINISVSENRGHPRIVNGFQPSEFKAQKNIFIECKSIEEFGELKQASNGKLALINDKIGNTYVCKHHSLDCNSEKYLKELEDSFSMIHPTILPFAGTINDASGYFILTKFCEKGTLDDLLKNNNGVTNSMKMICLIDVLLALIDVSQKKIVHKNINPSNIFIDDGFFKVGDFEIKDAKKSVSVPIGYHPPEVIVENKYSEKSDVFSFGMVAYELLTGKSIGIAGMTQQAFIQMIIDDSFLEDVRNEERKFLGMCLNADPEKRSSFEQLFEYLLGIGFNLIERADESVIRHVINLLYQLKGITGDRFAFF